MDLDPAFIAQCAPGVAPETIQAIVRVESGGHPLALGINSSAGRAVPDGARQAAQLAERYIQRGYSVDLGLMQVNSRHLGSLGLSVAEALDPCTNLRAGAFILTQAYHSAAARYGEGQRALQAALSAYNTGNLEAGFRNGYVARYLTAPPALPSPYTADTRIPLEASAPSRYIPPNPYSAQTRIPLDIDRRQR
jgi:type IV secretion system protein VirB1